MTPTEFLSKARRSLSARYATYRWRGFEAVKPVVQRRFPAPPAGTVFIFGCQRSGTTHLERLFRADPRSVVHGEFSDLSVTPDKTLWQPFDDMAKRIAQDHARYVVIRSLLASHRILDTLDAWPDASAFWVFRDANSVVDSMMRKWGGDFFEISKRVESAADGSWDLADLWSKIQHEARTLAPAAEGLDYWRNVYALFWCERNSLALDFNLAAHPRVIMADYADVTQRPSAYLDHALALAGVEPVGWRYPLETRKASHRSHRSKPAFAAPIQERCDALYDSLRAAAAPLRDRLGAQ